MASYNFFDRASCDLCGLCLNQCPIMEMPIDQARAEFKKLVDGEETEVLKKCTSCMSCNNFCPHYSRPYELILYRWYERYKEKGLPKAAKFFLPYQFPNFGSALMEHLPEDEKKTVESWARLKKCEEIFYPGCNMIFLSYLSFSKIFENVTFMGSQELCCGEPWYRIGLLETSEQIAKKLEKQLRNLGVKRMIIPCLACCNMFSNVYPRFGVNFDFEIIPLLDWLWEKIDQGKLKLKSKLNRTVTLHDNCQAKPFGNKYYDLSRKILESLGVKVIEMEHNKDKALCCGMAAFAGSHSVDDILNAAMRRYKEAENTGASALALYCGGCQWVLSIAKTLSQGKTPIFHILELVQMATGENLAHRNIERAQKILELAMVEAARADPKERFWAEKIE
ncbi:MAG: (Fe-S)-binding protein [Candidatus Freyarchaeum deiterrae]